MENLLEDVSFNSDGENIIGEFIVDKKYIAEKLGKELNNKDLKKYIL